MRTPELPGLLLATAAAVSAPLPLSAQDVEIVGKLKENLYADAPSSGAMIMGVQIVTDSRGDELSIGLHYPESSVTHLCVTAVSASGLYSASGWFRRLSPPQPGLVTARYESIEPEYLAKLGPEELGLLARAVDPPAPSAEADVQPACPPIGFDAGVSSDKALEAVASGWRIDTTRPGARLDVYVNSLASDGATISPSQSLSTGGRPCVEVQVARASAYNLRCSLPLDELGADPAELRIDFATDGQLDTSSWLTVHMPGEPG